MYALAAARSRSGLGLRLPLLRWPRRDLVCLRASPLRNLQPARLEALTRHQEVPIAAYTAGNVACPRQEVARVLCGVGQFPNSHQTFPEQEVADGDRLRLDLLLAGVALL